MIDPRKALEDELALTDEQRKAIMKVGSDRVEADNQRTQEQAQQKKQQAIDAPKEAAAASKRQDEMLQSKQSSNGIGKVASELGTAVVGAGIDAAEGIGATAERVLTGKVNDKNFTPTWLQVDDKVEPLNKTWWGNLIRGVGELGILSTLTRGAGKAIPSQAGKFLSGSGLRNEMVRGAIAGNFSSGAEGPNLSNALNDAIPKKVHELFPFIASPLAISESDSPIMKRVKSTTEGMLGDHFFGKIGAGMDAWRAKRAVDNEALRKTLVPRVENLAQAQARKTGIEAAKTEYEGLRNQWVAENNGAAVTASKIQAEVNALKSQAKKTGGAVDEAQLKILQERQARADAVEKAGQRLAKLKADDAIARKPPTPDEVAANAYESSLQKYTKASEKVDAENAAHFYEKDPEFLNGPHVRTTHPDLLDSHEKAKFVPDTDIPTALRNHIRIDTEPLQRDGRVGSMMTDAAIDRISGSSDAVRKLLKEMSDKLKRSPEVIAEINGRRLTKQDQINLVASKVLDTLDMIDGRDLNEVRDFLIKGANTETIAGKEWRQLNNTSWAATQILMKSTLGNLTDLATVERSVRGQVDTATQKAMYLDQLELFMRLHKEHGYVLGRGLQEMGVNWWQRILRDYSPTEPAEAASKRIDDEVKSVIGTIRELTDNHEDSRIINAFMDAAAMSNGDVRTMADLAAFAKKKIRLNGWLYGSAAEKGYVLRAFQSQYFNSVLSSIKTVGRAWAGNLTLVALRPIELFAGGAMRGDTRLMAKALHQFGAGFEAIGESLTLAEKSRKAWFAGDPDPMVMRGADEDYLPFHKTEEFQNYKAWAQLKGSTGDKVAIKTAEMISSFNSSPLVNYGMGLMGVGDTATRTILGRVELKSRAFDEAWIESGGKVSNELVHAYERKLRDSIFDEDGVVTDLAANLAAQEVTLTTPLSGFAKDIDEFVKKVPLARTFLMFPRTAANALRYTASYTPLLNKSLKEIDEVMNCTMEDAGAIMQKYGITDLEGARAMYEGRVALGMMTVGAAAYLYLNGKVTGNQAQGTEGKRLRTSLNGAPSNMQWNIDTPAGNYWVGYEGLGPIAQIIAMVCDTGEMADPEDQEEMLAKIGYFVAANVTNKSFLSGIGQLSDLVNGNASAFGPTYFANQANNAIPYGGARNWVAQVFAPGKRELDNDFYQRFANRNIALKDKLPITPDWMTGEPLKLNDPLLRLINASLPITINPGWDKTQQVIYKSGFDSSLAFRRGPDNEELSAADRVKMIQYASEGGRIKKELDRIVGTEKFSDSWKVFQKYLDDGGNVKDAPPKAMVHVRMIQDVVNKAKRHAMTRMRLEQERPGGPMSRAQISNMVKKAGKNGDVDQQQYYLNKLIETPQ